jgi:polar amino acid transport system ATP-binding protein
MPHGRDLARFRARIGMVFQQFDLFPHMTALGNVMSGPLIVKKMAPTEAEAIARQLLAKVGLATFTGALSARTVGRPAAARGDRARHGDGRRRSCCSTR